MEEKETLIRFSNKEKSTKKNTTTPFTPT